jgi:hypothetical protein
MICTSQWFVAVFVFAVSGMSLLLGMTLRRNAR